MNQDMINPYTVGGLVALVAGAPFVYSGAGKAFSIAREMLQERMDSRDRLWADYTCGAIKRPTLLNAPSLEAEKYVGRAQRTL